jgi:hypothetical protein
MKAVEDMNADDKYCVLNQAWIIANNLIRAHGADSEIGVDAARMQASIERIEPLFLFGEG